MGLLLLSCCGCCCRSRRRKSDDSEDLSAGGGEQDGGAKDVVEESSDLSSSSDDSSKSLDELNSSGPSDDLASPREGGPGRRAGVKPLPKKLIGRNWRIPLDYDQRKAIAEYLHQRKTYMRKELEKNRRAKREATDEHLASVRKSYDKATKKLVRQLDPLSAEQRHFCGYDIPVSHKREFELSAETSITVVLDNLHVPEERTFTVREPVRVFIPVGSASSVGAGAGSAAQLGIHFGLANLRSPSPRRSGPNHGDHDDVLVPPASALGDPPAVAGIPPAEAPTGKSSSKRPDSPSSSTMERELSGAPSTAGKNIEMDPLEAVPLPADGRQMTKESVASSAPSKGAASAASASSAVAYSTSLHTTSQSTGRPSSPLGSDSISSNYGINHLGAYEPNDYQDLSRGYWLPGRVTALGTSGEIEVKVGAFRGPRPLGREVEYLVFLPDQVRMGVLRKFAEENGDTKFRRKFAATSGMFSSKTMRGGRRQGGGGGGKAKVGAGDVGATSTSRAGSWMIPSILRGGKSKPSGLPPAASPRSPKMGGAKRTRPHPRAPSNFGTTSASGVSGSSSATRIDPAAKTGVSFSSGGAAATTARSTTEGALFLGGRGTTTMARSDQFVTTRTVFPTVNNVNSTEDSPPGSPPQGPASLPGGSRPGSRPCSPKAGSPKAELSEHHHQRAGPLVLDEFYVPTMCREEQLQSTGYHLTVGTKFGQRKDLGPKITHMPKWAADLGKPLAMVREPDETAFYVDPGVGDTPLRDPISTYELAFVREKTRLREAVYDQADGGWFRTEPLKRKNIRDKSPPPPRNKVQYEEKKARSQRESLALIDERKVELMPVMPLDEIFKRSGGRVRASEEEQDPDHFGV